MAALFAVVGATGNTGKGCVAELLSKGCRVRAIVRSEGSAEKLQAMGAETVKADVQDIDALAAAFAGVDGAYLLHPTGGQLPPDMIAHAKKVSQGMIAAATIARVPHVVALSSVGAQHATGTGGIVHAYNFEQLLKASALTYTIVRGPGFLENWGRVLGAVLSQSVLPTMYQDVNTKFPQAAATDVGVIAAQALIDGPRPVKGQPRIIEVHGPEEYSVSDVAKALSEVLGKPVTVSIIPSAQHVPILMSTGMSETNAKIFSEMYNARDLLQFDNQEARRGTISIVDFMRGLVKSAATAE